MSLFRMLKRNGRLSLSGRWGTAMGTGALVAGIFLLMAALEHTAIRLFVAPGTLSNPTMENKEFDLGRLTRELFAFTWVEILIAAVFVLMALLLLSPLRLGITRWYLALIQGETPGFGEIFYFFETMARYLRAVWFTVQYTLRMWFWGLVFFVLPGGLLGISVWFLRTEGISRETRTAASLGVVLACGLLMLAALLYTIYTGKYALAAYLLCESDAMTVGTALRTSVRYTRTYRGVIFLFSLSFLGWYLLAPLTLFFLMLYVGPYHNASSTLLARYLVEKNRLEQPSTTQEWHPVR